MDEDEKREGWKRVEKKSEREEPEKPGTKTCLCSGKYTCTRHLKTHWAPVEWEQRYMRMYELRDQAQMRRVTQDEVKAIRVAEGGGLGDLVGPPPDFKGQVAELGRQSNERRRIMAEIARKEQTAPPPGEAEPTQEPWSRIELTPTEIAIQSNRAEVMRAALMRTAHERKEITDEEFEQFRKTGMLPAKAYQPPEDRQ